MRGLLVALGLVVSSCGGEAHVPPGPDAGDGTGHPDASLEPDAGSSEPDAGGCGPVCTGHGEEGLTCPCGGAPVLVGYRACSCSGDTGTVHGLACEVDGTTPAEERGVFCP